MANEEQVKILKSGVEAWDQWRENNPGAIIDFIDANLSGLKLDRANLCYINFYGADLSRVDLSRSDLSNSMLSNADLSMAVLDRTNLSRALLTNAKFDQTMIGGTIFGDVDLSDVKDLKKAIHFSSSLLTFGTIERSKGKIPIEFLRGCGLNDWEIESTKLYQPELSSKDIDDILYRIHDLRATQAIQINPLFISYSHKDSTFVDKIEKHLDKKGIRFWRDIHHATAGRLEKVVDRAMRQNPTVLLVLSENSVQSDWVEHEARSARELEKELKRDVLCPVALDEAWKDYPWPARLREQIMEYNILDFSNWKDEAEFGKKFARLVEGLDLFYKE